METIIIPFYRWGDWLREVKWHPKCLRWQAAEACLSRSSWQRLSDLFSCSANHDTLQQAFFLIQSFGLRHFVSAKSLSGFPGGTGGKEPACQHRRLKRWGFDPSVGKILCRRAWQPTPVFLPGKSHGQRCLAGYSPRGCRELDMTEQLSTHTDLYGKI